jgi:hypothetical protein
MARTPFKLRSGNTTPFKQMGSSPVKDNGDVNPEGTTLYEYYKTKMPSMSERATMYTDFGGEGKYTGSASQNIKLLSQIKEKATKPPPSGNGDGDGNGGGDKSKNIIDQTISKVGKVVEGIGKLMSSPNIDVTTGKKPSTNIKEGMDRKYGTGEYKTGGSKAHFRMKSGESKFKYQRRMQKLKRTNPELFKTEE